MFLINPDFKIYDIIRPRKKLFSVEVGGEKNLNREARKTRECRMFCFLNTSSKVDNQGCKNLSCICSDKNKHFFGLTDITAY